VCALARRRLRSVGLLKRLAASKLLFLRSGSALRQAQPRDGYLNLWNCVGPSRLLGGPLLDPFWKSATQRYISQAGSRRLPDVEFRQLRCDIVVLGGRACTAGVIVVVNSADMAIEAALGDDRRAEEIITSKGGPVNILGINSVYHDSAAALLVDGRLAVAVEEERFNRIKHGKLPHVDNPHQFPERAIRSAWITPGSPPAISITWHTRSTPNCAERDFAPSGGWIRGSRKSSCCGSVRCAVSPRSFLDVRCGKDFISCPPSGTCRLGIFPSGFDRAAILIIDGLGEVAGSTWRKPSACTYSRSKHSTIRTRLALYGRSSAIILASRPTTPRSSWAWQPTAIPRSSVANSSRSSASARRIMR